MARSVLEALRSAGVDFWGRRGRVSVVSEGGGASCQSQLQEQGGGTRHDDESKKACQISGPSPARLQTQQTNMAHHARPKHTGPSRDIGRAGPRGEKTQMRARCGEQEGEPSSEREVGACLLLSPQRPSFERCASHQQRSSHLRRHCLINCSGSLSCGIGQAKTGPNPAVYTHDTHDFPIL
jgi:hypothetical protein